jgi:hypothetical protein
MPRSFVRVVNEGRRSNLPSLVLLVQRMRLTTDDAVEYPCRHPYADFREEKTVVHVTRAEIRITSKRAMTATAVRFGGRPSVCATLP